MEKKENIVEKFDRIVLAGTILLLIITFTGFVMSISSFGRNYSDDNTLFSFKSGSVILLDNNINFKFPERIIAKDNLVIVIRNGTYYWKIEDAIPEDVIELNITESVVYLKLKKTSEGYNVVNSDNSTLNVDIYKKGGFTGRMILESKQDKEISEVVYIGGEND